MAMSNFYERQLVLLIVVCVVVLLLERWVSSRDKPQDPTSVAGAEVNNSLEDEDNKSVSSTPTGALSTLMRKYLTVYAIVMGAFSVSPPLY